MFGVRSLANAYVFMCIIGINTKLQSLTNVEYDNIQIRPPNPIWLFHNYISAFNLWENKETALRVGAKGMVRMARERERQAKQNETNSTNISWIHKWEKESEINNNNNKKYWPNAFAMTPKIRTTYLCKLRKQTNERAGFVKKRNAKYSRYVKLQLAKDNKPVHGRVLIITTTTFNSIAWK